jgi:hypothetical protein
MDAQADNAAMLSACQAKPALRMSKTFLALPPVFLMQLLVALLNS